MTIQQIIQLSQMGLTAEQIEQVSQISTPVQQEQAPAPVQPEQIPAPTQPDQTPAPAQIPVEFATAMTALSGQIDRLTAAMRSSNITNSQMPPQPSTGDTAAAYLANIIAPSRKE